MQNVTPHVARQTAFFLNSGTLDGSSGVLKESQGVSATSADPGWHGARGLCPAVAWPRPKPTNLLSRANAKSTFLLLEPSWCLKKPFKTHEKNNIFALGTYQVAQRNL